MRRTHQLLILRLQVVFLVHVHHVVLHVQVPFRFRAPYTWLLAKELALADGLTTWRGLTTARANRTHATGARPPVQAVPLV